MKNKSIICALLLACGVGVSTTSCEDMLSADSDRTIHTNANDTLYGYWGIMKAVQNIAERYVILGEARADLVYPTSYAADTISNIANFKMANDGDCRFLDVKDYYTVINGCNNYLANVDSVKTNSSGKKVMEKEIAQVLAVRAWTYLQLVNNYGEVPFYTEPITSLGFIDDFDFSKEKNKLNRSNLIAKLVPDLLPYRSVALPDYGSYNNGSVSIASTLTMFPLKLVLGDIYLTGASSDADYEMAAQSYYDYLKENGGFLPTTLNCSAFEERSEISYSSNSWMGAFSSTSSPAGKNNTQETITVIPSSAGKLYGTILTGIANVFGYEVTSSMNTSSEEGNEASATTSASVTAYKNINYRQLGPSEQYFSLCADQEYIQKQEVTEVLEVLERAGDARQVAAIGSTGFGTQVEAKYISKSCYSGFSYTYPVIYRKALVWLRYAEALNRLGMPSYAFAVLKNGLCNEYLPVKSTISIETPDGELRDSIVYDTINKACYYIPVEEYDRAQAYSKEGGFMNFTSEFTSLNGTEAANIGVHARGCGDIGEDMEFYTYNKMLAKQGVDTLNASMEQKILAIENLIVDELALETAWEGNRYPDLLRIANRRGADGVHWFADKIARRGDTRDPNINYTGTAEYIYLYEKLSNPDNWYLKLPSYK